MIYNNNNTPLHYAVQHSTINSDIDQDQLAIVTLLLQSGADANARNIFNQSPLMLTKNPNITKLLVEFGATND